MGTWEDLRKGAREKLVAFDEKAQKLKDNVEAGVDVAASTVKTVGKRVIGDDSATELKPKTKQTLGIK
jgi:hypothetical protein